jgi:cobalt-zinc-cadmium efflux system membrane fusion protein
LRRQEVRSPIAGRVVERKVDLGAAVGRDNLETELFVVVDLDRLWVEIAVGSRDLAAIREGQTVTVTVQGTPEKVDGTIIFISPLLDKETRSARVVAEIQNTDGRWRPGSFITATITIEELSFPTVVPTSAVQTMGAEQVVFVRTPEGFAKRPVVLGRSADSLVEVVSGVQAGETIAVANTFALKAELMKALAED